MTPLRIVSPYRPFAPESPAHQLLGAFDWIGALRMLQTTVVRQGYEFAAITDRATVLPVPTINLPTSATRLMLWILDVSLRYLESDAFDRDTVMVSPDSLVMGDLRRFFAGDLTILVRPARRFTKRPILNSVQCWPVGSKDKLIAFYRQALTGAERLPDNVITWGADSEAIRELVAPIQVGIHSRAGLQVAMVESGRVMESLTTSTMHRVERGERVSPLAPVVDFKYLRKQFMPTYFARVCGAAR